MAGQQGIDDRFVRLSRTITDQLPPENPYSLAKDTMQRDLADERPTWILSAYGPGKDAPEQLFGGYPREQSFEEIRLHYMQGLAAGNPQGAVS